MYLGNFKGALWWFLWGEGEGVCSEVRAGSLQCENDTGVVVETAGEAFGMEQPDCGGTVCMERVEGYRAVLSVCFGLQGNMELEQLQSGASEDEGREGSSR